MHRRSYRRFHPLLVIGAVLLALVLPVRMAAAEDFRVSIMQAKEGAANKYQSLEAYLKLQDIDVTFVPTESYPAAAEMFAKGEVDGMFSGSGVAGTMIIKDLAYPIVRPQDRQGRSTYWAVVVAPEGAPPFTGDAEYFRAKRVALCALASSGEFYFRSLAGSADVGAELFFAGSHGEALAMLERGEADVAVVKNLVWDGMAGQYPGLAQVGSDSGQNPNGTLIIAETADRELVKRVAGQLLKLSKDAAPEAAAAREQLGIEGFLVTSAGDFKHTLALLRQAGVGPAFAFQF